MAKHASTTRRMLFAAAALFPAIPALAQPALKPDRCSWPAFVQTMTLMHPNGREAALHAMEGGVRLEDLSFISLHGLGRPNDQLPILMFKGQDASLRRFDPQGEF